ncbi:DUF802 domain-containing protein [Bacillus sp. NP157]|nr:DUF802 domain-containing protein [Bacillus sp. NP157]
MPRHFIHLVVFLAGFVAVCWVGIGYLGTNPLGSFIAAMIAIGYCVGALELQRYRMATVSLFQAVDELSAPPASLGTWLDRVNPSLRNAVRLRVEGERVALPAPTLAPYLVGLLVLLGMLGTLLGMMATLRGTGIALESATDLGAIRSSLAAPVKGLGFAFGTSIAGVATSAMLGLLVALARRERAEAVQLLDAKASSTLREFSQAHQREASFRLLQQQTELMPALVERLQGMMSALEQQGTAASERHASSQDTFHTRIEATFERLAASVEKSLKDGVADGARAASTALQPVVDATMQGIARDTAALHASVTDAVDRQVTSLATGFDATTEKMAVAWHDAIAEQRTSGAQLAADLRDSLQAFNVSFDERSTSMVSGLHEQQATAAASASARQAALLTTLTEQQGTLVATLTARQADLLGHVTERHDTILHALAEAQAALVASVSQEQRALGTALGSQWQDVTTALNERLEQMAASLATSLTEASASFAATTDTVGARWSDTLVAQREAQASTAASVLAAFEGQALALIEAMKAAQGELQATLESRDAARLDAWTTSLNRTADQLATQWTEAGDRAVAQHQATSETLASLANDITTQSQAHASATIAEISRLVDAASEAPKAAADVVAELRQKLSDSMVRDTAMLEERSRLLETLETLLGAVNHASTEQRAAIDGLVTTSADLLDRVGTRFIEHVQGETGKLEGVAERITGSADHVAGLGEAFGTAVQAFGQANDALLTRLQEIGEALDRSLVRSDEQLAYYVAQAREVVDLSVLSQKQILEDMQQLATKRGGKA